MNGPILTGVLAVAVAAAGTLVPAPAPGPPLGQDPDSLPGQVLFDAICAECHSLDPPARQAPPMRHIVRHLRARFGDDGAVLEHVTGYLPDPAAERSALPPMAVERFGLMPPQPLPPDLLREIGGYLLTLDDGAAGSPGDPVRRRRGAARENGVRGMHGHGHGSHRGHGGGAARASAGDDVRGGGASTCIDRASRSGTCPRTGGG
jgi:hypothetical protein